MAERERKHEDHYPEVDAFENDPGSTVWALQDQTDNG
jgi:hypothetical protein